MAKIGSGKYPTVEVTNIPLNEGQTTSNKVLLKKAFTESPLNNGYDVDALIELSSEVLNPKGADPNKRIQGNFQFIDQSLDYVVNIGDDDVPLSSEQDPSRPSTKFTPNLSSPGPGKTEPDQMQVFTLNTTDLKPNLDAGNTEGTLRPADPKNNTKITVGSRLTLGSSKPEQQ